MSETALVALVGSVLAFLSVVSTSLSAVLVARMRTLKRDVATAKSDVAAVKHEVKNDHKTNLREEQDARHDENSQLLKQILDVVGWLANGWVDNRHDITDLQERTGQGNTRRARRLARARPPLDYTDIPGGTS